jgi:integrase
VAKVLLAAAPEVQDYLVAVMDTLARVGEINRLTWQDVDFEESWVVLYTRKKRGGHLTSPEGAHDHPAPRDAPEAA